MQFMTRIRRRAKGTIWHITLFYYYLLLFIYLFAPFRVIFFFYDFYSCFKGISFLNGFIFNLLIFFFILLFWFFLFVLPPGQNNDLTRLLGFRTSHAAISCVRSEQREREREVSLEIPAKSDGQSSKSTMGKTMSVYMCFESGTLLMIFLQANNFSSSSWWKKYDDVTHVKVQVSHKEIYMIFFFLHVIFWM